jgi:hypothetical protein
MSWESSERQKARLPFRVKMRREDRMPPGPIYGPEADLGRLDFVIAEPFGARRDAASYRCLRERTLSALSIKDRNDPLTEFIAKKIFELGQTGLPGRSAHTANDACPVEVHAVGFRFPGPGWRMIFLIRNDHASCRLWACPPAGTHSQNLNGLGPVTRDYLSALASPHVRAVCLALGVGIVQGQNRFHAK